MSHVYPVLHRPVTGPDGDNPISDEQIRELLIEARTVTSDGSAARLCEIALGYRANRRWLNQPQKARSRCADAYNARHAGKERR